MKPLISIIVPVYNSEKILNRCINSILKQSFRDWELILINDGSTDKSGNICDQYANKDERIRVFHKKNGGVSSARNMGLNYAIGKWITFVDSDDCLTDYAFELNWNDISEDLILFPFYFNYRDGSSELFSLRTSGIIKNLIPFFEKEFAQMIFKVPWSKLYRNELIESLRFDEKIKCGEDTLFVINYLKNIKSCNVQGKPLYIFNQDSTLFHIKYQQPIESSIYALSMIYSAYEVLNFKCLFFEKNIFFDFKSCCQDEINKRPLAWFNNKVVKRIYSNIKQGMGFEQRLRYKLLSFAIISKINVLLRRR